MTPYAPSYPGPAGRTPSEPTASPFTWVHLQTLALYLQTLTLYPPTLAHPPTHPPTTLGGCRQPIHFAEPSNPHPPTHPPTHYPRGMTTLLNQSSLPPPQGQGSRNSLCPSRVYLMTSLPPPPPPRARVHVMTTVGSARSLRARGLHVPWQARQPAVARTRCRGRMRWGAQGEPGGEGVLQASRGGVGGLQVSGGGEGGGDACRCAREVRGEVIVGGSRR